MRFDTWSFNNGELVPWADLIRDLARMLTRSLLGGARRGKDKGLRSGFAFLSKPF